MARLVIVPAVVAPGQPRAAGVGFPRRSARPSSLVRMLRRLIALLLALAVAAALAAPAAAHEDGGDPAADGGDASRTAPDAARAWVLADAGTGAILAAVDHHEPHYVASLAKVMTAFVALEQLQMSNTVRVSELAAEQPAMRIGMSAGETWELEHVLHSLLMVSANDAAYAVAEAAGEDLEGFSRLMQRTAERLGTEDSEWNDPAGLDGDEGFRGGTRASAHDLAILARNAMEVPEIMDIAAKPTYEFRGGDGEDHTLTNHNEMLETFPGLTGLKTGYTEAAGHTLIATAERDGRRLVAVVVGATDPQGTAAALLNQGFNTRAGSRGIGEVLPDTSFARAEPPPIGGEEVAETGGAAAAAEGGGGIDLARVLTLLLVVLVAAFFARREQIKRRKRRRRATRRAYLQARRRGMIQVVDGEPDIGNLDGAPDPSRSGHVLVVGPDEERWSVDHWRRVGPRA